MTELANTRRRPKLAKLVKYAFIVLGFLAAVVGVWAIHTYRYKGDVEHISFQSGDVTMKGLFIKPDGSGPHPVVVLLHGSGPLAGDGPPVRAMANAFLRSGIGVLAYDKRGVGSSGGTFHHNAYGDFIDDGINAVRYLASREDVDSDAIGLLGSSEGGWFAPEIAVRTGAVAFIVDRAGSPLPWIETNLWQLRHDLVNAGISGDLLSEAVELHELVWRFLVKMNADPSLVDSEEWRHVDDELASFARTYGQDETWLKQGRRLDEKLPDYGELYRSQAKSVGYDPQPYIEQLDIPLLYIFGENDENIPTTASVKYLEDLQSKSGSDIEISVIPGVDHTMITPTGFAFTGSYVPAFLDAIGPWAAAKISTESPSR